MILSFISFVGTCFGLILRVLAAIFDGVGLS